MKTYEKPSNASVFLFLFLPLRRKFENAGVQDDFCHFLGTWTSKLGTFGDIGDTVPKSGIIGDIGDFWGPIDMHPVIESIARDRLSI